jgi:heat shock protein HslJ
MTVSSAVVKAGALGALAAAIAAGSTSAAASQALTSQPWQLTRLAGINRKATGITAEFTSKGTVSGFSGCNQYNGSYTASGSAIRVSSKMATTMMACAKMVMLEERVYLKALTSARSYAVKDGTLTLRSKRGFPLAAFEAQSQSLDGTSWNVLSYNNGKQAVVSVIAGTKLTADFSKSNVSGSAGCNTYNASVTTTPPKISFGPIASTRMACSQPPGVMEQESAFLAALQSAATYNLQGSTLELRTAGGSIAVSMQRS